MKRILLPRVVATAVVAGLLALAVPASGQAEKVKQKAKELKKNVEGGPTQTNKPPPPPPKAPPAPPVPQKPSK